VKLAQGWVVALSIVESAPEISQGVFGTKASSWDSTHEPKRETKGRDGERSYKCKCLPCEEEHEVFNCPHIKECTEWLKNKQGGNDGKGAKEERMLMLMNKENGYEEYVVL
jgi:hypothetical protein